MFEIAIGIFCLLAICQFAVVRTSGRGLPVQQRHKRVFRFCTGHIKHEWLLKLLYAFFIILGSTLGFASCSRLQKTRLEAGLPFVSHKYRQLWLYSWSTESSANGL